MATRLAAWLCAVVAPLLLAASAVGHTLAGNKAAARNDAQALLGRVQLPAGAVQSAGEPAGGGSALANAALSIGTTALVDAHEWWTVPGSMSSVTAYVKAHVPQGGKLESSGSGSQRGTSTDEYVEFSFPAVRGVLFVRQLVVDVAALAGGDAGVRADVEIEWTVPRPAGERVPRVARVLTVTRSTLKGWTTTPLSVTLTNPTTVHRAARLLNRLEVVQPQAVSCPALFPAPIDTLTFSADVGGPPLAVATMPVDGPEGGCAPITFSVRGHREPPLDANPSFLHRLAKVLGVSLH